MARIQQIVRRLDPWEIAGQICKLPNEEREVRLAKLDITILHYGYTLPEMVRSWLKDYDNDFIDTKKFLNDKLL